VTELLDGTLDQLLFKSNISLSVMQRLQFALEIAQGYRDSRTMMSEWPIAISLILWAMGNQCAQVSVAALVQSSNHSQVRWLNGEPVTCMLMDCLVIQGSQVREHSRTL